MPKSLNFEILAKAGYAARGVVFLLVAALALFSGVSGGSPETKSAVTTLLQQPFGRLWVCLIGAGLLGFVLWRVTQSLFDSDGHGSDGKGLTIRVALLGSAVTYFGLASFAIGLAFFAGGENGSSAEKGLAGWIMSQPFGSYLAILVGFGFVIGGIITATKGLLRKFEKYVSIPKGNIVLTYICIYGLVARGIVFAITGTFFAYAGFRVDPTQAGSMADALEWVHQLPYGSFLYACIAIGLAAFGAYNFIEARYRQVRGPKLASAKQRLRGMGL